MNLDIGIHRAYPAGHYHALPGASASKLRVIHESTPAHLRHRMDEIDAPGIELVMGTLIHQRVLEPATPLPAVAVVPENYVVPADYRGGLRDPKPGDVEPWNWRRKYCQQWRASQEAAGLIVLTREQLDEVDRAAEAVYRNTEATELLAACDTEVTMVWETVDGDRCKARVDAMPRNVSAPIVDIKTTIDASPAGFAKKAWDLGYHLQAAWYLDGAAALHGTFPGFAFIAYEKGVGLVTVHHASPEFIAAGRDAYTLALRQYVEAERSGVWPGYPSTSVVLDVPRWARRDA